MSTQKTVLITGASQGIGSAIAQTLAKENYSLHLCGRDKERLAENADKIKKHNPHVTFSAFDLSQEEEVTKFVAKWEGPLYGIVNNAGICKTERLDEQKSTWDEVIATNLAGPYLLTKGLLPHIVDDGRIVNISSQLGKEGRAGYSAYCASKFGLIGMTKCWAKELGSRGITVNAVCPGWVKTKMAERDIDRLASENNLSPKEYYEMICAPLELKRFTTPEEVSNLVAFLISEKSSGITGRDILMHTIWNQE